MLTRMVAKPFWSRCLRWTQRRAKHPCFLTPATECNIETSVIVTAEASIAVPLESPLQGSVRTRAPEARLVQTICTAPTVLTLTTRTAPTPHGSWAFALLKLAAGHIFEEGKVYSKTTAQQMP